MYIADFYYFVSGVGAEDENNARLKDAKSAQIWERNFWNVTFHIHGQHMSALQRYIKFYTLHPDDPKLNARSTSNFKNPYAPDRYYKGWGNMRDMRTL